MKTQVTDIVNEIHRAENEKNLPEGQKLCRRCGGCGRTPHLYVHHGECFRCGGVGKVFTPAGRLENALVAVNVEIMIALERLASARQDLAAAEAIEKPSRRRRKVRSREMARNTIVDYEYRPLRRAEVALNTLSESGGRATHKAIDHAWPSAPRSPKS